MRWVLIRHGRTWANERRLYCGISDVELSQDGRKELLSLKQSRIYPQIEGLVKITSGMKRTDETMCMLFDAEPDLRMKAFGEINFGRFELRGYEELKSDLDYQAWIMDESGDMPMPGGESAGEFRKRVFAAADCLERDALVVCHGGVIAALMERWFPQEERSMYQWQPGFGCGYDVRCENGRYTYCSIASGYND